MIPVVVSAGMKDSCHILYFVNKSSLKMRQFFVIMNIVASPFLCCPAVFDTKNIVSFFLFFFSDILKMSFFSFFSDKKFVALKVVKSAAHYTETALDEIKLLKCVSVIYNKKNVYGTKTYFTEKRIIENLTSL